MAEATPLCNFGWKAPAFRLQGTDGRLHALNDLKGPRGTLIMFICNHCPYVQAVVDRLVRDARELAGLGVSSVAISSNDAEAYPEDDYAHMQAEARRHGFPFPYLYDETQEVARAYLAVCTPDFFGFNARMELQYRGRIDASGRNPAPPSARRELFEAMKGVAETGRGPREQHPSMGCSIKWKV
ncbi:MAG: thioredoxin family protein [Hyphomicrobium sp.]